MKRLAVARLWHEGNSFSPVPTTLADFKRREWVRGDEARDFYRGTATELGAAVEFADKHADWSVTFLRCAAAAPAGPIEDGCLEAIRAELVEDLRQEKWSAVYLSLHGAMIAASDPAADLTLLRTVRSAIGDAPLAASLDLHANIGPPLLDLADIAVGYKSYPHTDMRETGAKALALLADMADGRVRPMGALAKIAAILPSFAMRTGDGPMAEVAALARALAARRGLLDISVFGGFAYGDSPHAGAGVLAYGDRDRAPAEAAAREIAAELTARRDRFYVTLPSPTEGIAAALAAPPGTVAVLDPADNPLSGGIGDTPALLRALLAAAPQAPALFAFFHDPPLVARAADAGLDRDLACRLGGRISDAFGPPIEIEARVIRLTDGKFRNRGPMETNLPVDLGRTAVLRTGNIRIIVSESCQAPNDPAYFDLHGVDLAATRLLCAKAKNHFRAAFAPVCTAIIDVDAPGPAALDLRVLPFRHAPRRLFPLTRSTPRPQP